MESRRSSRAARAGTVNNSNHSSASSNNSNSSSRPTRNHQKIEKPESTPGSLSSEPPDEISTPAEDPIQIQTRRQRSQRENEISQTIEIATDADAMDNDSANDGDDNEVVRCICGFDDYKQPQLTDEQQEEYGSDHFAADSDLFIACNICSVWQHGVCVSIMSEALTPDDYFCELCRPSFHKIYVDKNGQKFSTYLALDQDVSTTTSRAASFSKDGTRSPRGGSKGRNSSSLQSAKRRSTMNSRDAAYDEEQQILRAIEASKGGASGESTDGGGTRRGKRERSDSEEKPDDAKRQRTQSASPSPLPENNQTQQADSDNEANGRPIGAKKIRGAAARNHREKELREERERSRQEAATKRKGRAERRRIEDSDPSEELPLAARASITKTTEVAAQPLDPPASSQVATPDTPPPQPPISHKKGGRPPNSRKGKLGKNQYTKDRDLQNEDDRSPHRSQSRDVPRNDDSGNTSAHKGSISESKPAKSRHTNSKVSMGDMRKRVTAILDFISRTQLEMAGEFSMSADAEKTIRGIADGLPMIKVNGGNGAGPQREFGDLTCTEMMDVLTRQLVKWQKEFA